ncbi:hypothetical protein BOTBODRAFT_188730 [Botryobasidium botryosum FD-172 SS1]|uniref:Mitochondrial escape protein 2 n=1 Tax=Botryobasidium botryosum (strain FD-172 SS1) TaxID=930990 RepID=A0A067MNP3_BOTB1|nr:hypothetical protein BOTBODRAFT_188730 [Botryobasidium botryosum FD-172 SS1]
MRGFSSTLFSRFAEDFGTIVSFRHYIAALEEDELLERLERSLGGGQGIPNVYGFKVLKLEPRPKDGGVFVHFQYNEPPTAVAPALNTNSDVLRNVESFLRDEVEKQGGISTWLGLEHGRLWLVKGKPWKEDLFRFPSPLIKVEFEGPDVHQEQLYEILRSYGHIVDITRPQPVPAGTPRSSIVSFTRLRSATIAHNCAHGLVVPSVESGKSTRLAIFYERQIKPHLVRDWVTGHPRIVLPLLVFFFGSMTYIIFDPIRIFSVEGKMLDWFNYKNYPLVKWLRRNTIDQFTFPTHHAQAAPPARGHDDGVWKERTDAEAGLKAYFSEYPSTILFVHGPAGSGKSTMLGNVLKKGDRKVLTIDCAEINKAIASDSALVTELAKQTGYWPVFSFLSSLNNVIDIASVGLIGQKVGFSSSVENQLKDILAAVGTGLKRVKVQNLKIAQEKLDSEGEETQAAIERRALSQRIRRGLYHDGRIDCVAGSGVMCELGFGDEALREEDADADPVWEAEDVLGLEHRSEKMEGHDESEHEAGAEKRPLDILVDHSDIAALPIVIIKNYSRRGAERVDVLAILSDWAAGLAQDKVAHVVVMSDNRENMKKLAKSLPARPLATIALADADAKSALGFVRSKLADAGIIEELDAEQAAYVSRLGGRAQDLEALVYKVRNGQNVKDAVEDIITRGVGELRKNAFGDDADDAKALPWTRQQAWIVLKQLAKNDEIAYADLLMNFPFSGDESALREMEIAELIMITTHDGLPYTIKPGRPVYKYVFERLVQDTIFQASQDVAFNEKAIAAAESTVRSCESELVTLKTIGFDTGRSLVWGGGAMDARANYLLRKMNAAGEKIEKLEDANARLKKVLSRSF